MWDLYAIIAVAEKKLNGEIVGAEKTLNGEKMGAEKTLNGEIMGAKGWGQGTVRGLGRQQQLVLRVGGQFRGDLHAHARRAWTPPCRAFGQSEGVRGHRICAFGYGLGRNARDTRSIYLTPYKTYVGKIKSR